MARITAKKIRQFFVTPGVSVAAGTTPETIELFNEDGTPYVPPSDGGGSGPGLIWAGQYDNDTDYQVNNLVRYLDHIYTSINDTPSGLATPTNEVALPSESSLAGDADPLLTAKGLNLPDAIMPAGVTTFVWFFDLSAGGTISLTGLDVESGSEVNDIYLYNVDGESVESADTFLSPSSSYTVEDLPPGRYYVLLSRTDEDPGVQFTLVLTDGAIVVDPINWELIL